MKCNLISFFDQHLNLTQNPKYFIVQDMFEFFQDIGNYETRKVARDTSDLISDYLYQ